jgi:hypothetical protein
VRQQSILASHPNSQLTQQLPIAPIIGAQAAFFSVPALLGQDWGVVLDDFIR